MAANPSTVYSLALLTEYTHSLDSLPLELSRNFADLRELDAVLSSSIASLTTKIQTLTAMIESDSPSATKEERLWMLADIAEEAQRLKLGGEDKIRVASQAADNLNGQTTHLGALLESIPNFNPTSLIRKTTYPHVSAKSFMPVNTDNGRRRRGGFGSLMHSSNVADPTTAAAKRKRGTNKEDDVERSPRKERVEAGSSRARNGARNRRAASPTESILSASSHLPAASARNGLQPDFPPAPPAKKQRSRAGAAANSANTTPANASTNASYTNANGTNTNGHYAHENGYAYTSNGGVPPLSSATAHPSLPAPLHANGANGAHQYEMAGGEWITPAPNQLAGPGMPVTRGNNSNNVSGGPTTTSGGDEMDEVGEVDEVDDTRYCICKGLSHGNMIACDDENCETEWFHYGCIGLIDPPEGTWYCDACIAKQSKRSRGSKRKTNNRSRAKD